MTVAVSKKKKKRIWNRQCTDRNRRVTVFTVLRVTVHSIKLLEERGAGLLSDMW